MTTNSTIHAHRPTAEELLFEPTANENFMAHAMLAVQSQMTGLAYSKLEDTLGAAWRKMSGRERNRVLHELYPNDLIKHMFEGDLGIYMMVMDWGDALFTSQGVDQYGNQEVLRVGDAWREQDGSWRITGQISLGEDTLHFRDQGIDELFQSFERRLVNCSPNQMEGCLGTLARGGLLDKLTWPPKMVRVMAANLYVYEEVNPQDADGF